MPRVKRGTKRRARRKKLLKHAKGFFLTKGKLFRSAKEAVNRSLRYTYRDRRTRKRDYRTLWIQRIGAAARNNGITYNQLIHGLKVAGVDLDRKILADMAVRDAEGFAALVASAKQHMPRRRRLQSSRPPRPRSCIRLRLRSGRLRRATFASRRRTLDDQCMRRDSSD